MKVTTKETNTFKPFTIEVTIESIKELKDLHNRLNLNACTINRELCNTWCNEYTYDLFDLVDDKLSENGIIYDM